MAEERDLTFPPFRLELANERLWRGSEPLSLRPKAFRLLRYLAEHPERLLTQEELRKALWQHGYVSDSLLRGYIRQLREVLGDDAKDPRFIETAGGRGYRFIAPLTSTRLLPSFNESSVSPTLQPRSAPLNVSEMINRPLFRAQGFGKQVRGRHCILDCEIDSNPTHRRHSGDIACAASPMQTNAVCNLNGDQGI